MLLLKNVLGITKKSLSDVLGVAKPTLENVLGIVNKPEAVSETNIEERKQFLN